MIASHYADPVPRALAAAAALRSAPDEAADILAELSGGTPFALLDDRSGWAWGYAGVDRLVGYVPSAALANSAPTI